MLIKFQNVVESKITILGSPRKLHSQAEVSKNYNLKGI